jgi:hypothetical protein
MGTFRLILLRTEFKLIAFLSYIGGLVYTWIIGHSWLHVLYAHIAMVGIFSIIIFGRDVVIFFFAPVIAAGTLVETYLVEKYLRQFKQNEPAEVAIVLGHSDWFKFQAWVKLNVTRNELKCLVRCLEAKEQNFSFFPNATSIDVEEIMRNESIREVYFVGHGDSHTFQLNTDERLFYCEFNDPKYYKDFVHQVHCGSPHGKSLRDYVVPEENRAKCFLFRKQIRVLTIERELKRREKIARGERS